jgi:hypothetical protein
LVKRWHESSSSRCRSKSDATGFDHDSDYGRNCEDNCFGQAHVTNRSNRWNLGASPPAGPPHEGGSTGAESCSRETFTR